MKLSHQPAASERRLVAVARAGALIALGLAVFVFAALQTAANQSDSAQPQPLAVATPVDVVSTVPSAAEVLRSERVEADQQQHGYAAHGG